MSRPDVRLEVAGAVSEAAKAKSETARGRSPAAQGQAAPAARGEAAEGHSLAARQAFLRDLRRCQFLAWALDARFRIGRVRFGIDALVGLASGVGDVVMALVGLYMAVVAWRHGLGGWTVFRIVLNLLIDVLLGAFPVLGDGLDVVFKAHLRNVRILERRAWEIGLILPEQRPGRAEPNR